MALAELALLRGSLTGSEWRSAVVAGFDVGARGLKFGEGLATAEVDWGGRD